MTIAFSSTWKATNGSVAQKMFGGKLRFALAASSAANQSVGVGGSKGGLGKGYLRVFRIDDPNKNLSVRNLRIVELRQAGRDPRSPYQRDNGGENRAEHGEFKHHDQIRIGRNDRHAAG